MLADWLLGFRAEAFAHQEPGPQVHCARMARTGVADRRFVPWEVDGAEQVMLCTDLANRTSNGVYARLGYVQVDEAVEYAFE